MQLASCVGILLSEHHAVDNMSEHNVLYVRTLQYVSTYRGESPVPQPAAATATTVLDSMLFRDAFGTSRMREIFSDYALIARCVEVEVALARTEARCGVIPTV